MLALATKHVSDTLRGGARLREQTDPEFAAAVMTLARLRLRARAKFERASEMFFSRPLLEQASAEVVSTWRARRFAPYPVVADLCCGLGGDTMGLARRNPDGSRSRVVAIDDDPLAVRLAQANLSVCGLRERVSLVRADVRQLPAHVPAAFADPSRRREGFGEANPSRTRRPDRMQPSLNEILALRSAIPDLGIKLAPAVRDAELDLSLAGIEHEREVISVAGECRELVVWTGGLATSVRRATRLPAGDSLTGSGAEKLDIRAPGCYLYEPDAAAIRAGLVAQLADRIGGWGICSKLCYVSSDAPAESPWLSGFRLRAIRPFSRRALVQMLREHGVVRPVIKTRGFAVHAEQVQRWLGAPAGNNRSAVVFLTRIERRPTMMLGERIGAGTR